MATTTNTPTSATTHTSTLTATTNQTPAATIKMPSHGNASEISTVSMPTSLNFATVLHMNVSQLKTLLRKRNLSISGESGALRCRILESYSLHQNHPRNGPFTATTETKKSPAATEYFNDESH